MFFLQNIFKVSITGMPGRNRIITYNNIYLKYDTLMSYSS
ncbi:hypothetical protein HMPREF1548_01233 [Clostridium sp. KLE 1755]|nr:hypothetical protein HMPREF1548_01233 [Clostridium sp. KLE 1755]